MRFLIFTLPIVANTLIYCNGQSASGETKENFDSCWDLGFVDYLSSAADCQLACSLKPNCNSWGYNYDRGDKRCHLCTWDTPRTERDCTSPCSVWGKKDDSISPKSIVTSAVEKSKQICSGKIQGTQVLKAATALNSVINSYRDGNLDSDAEFMSALPNLADKAARALSKESPKCFRLYTGPQHKCKFGSYLFYQLRALLLYVDGNPKRALRGSVNRMRKNILMKHKVYVVDNGWFNSKTLKSLYTFYSQLPRHLKMEGIKYDALFATQSVRDAWKCNGQVPGSLSISNRGYNVFQVQVGQASEQGFPSDTPDRVGPADLQLVVTRHEVSHQFDRIIENRSDGRLKQLKLMLTQESAGSNYNWLRSDVGDAYFQGATQEIIASQIGNQYFQSSTAQFRLAAHRLGRGTGLPMSWFLFNVDLLTPPDSNKAPFYEDEMNGEVRLVYVTLTRDDSGRITALDVPSCGEFQITYDNKGIVDSISGDPTNCKIVCADDPNWRNKNNLSLSCQWVGAEAKKVKNRCKAIGIDGRSAFDGCPSTCSKCP